eukprot:5711792-Amphidinium_carterae.1
MSVTIQTNPIDRMFSHPLMRPHRKRSGNKIGHLHRNYQIGDRFRGRSLTLGQCLEQIVFLNTQLRPKSQKLRTAWHTVANVSTLRKVQRAHEHGYHCQPQSQPYGSLADQRVAHAPSPHLYPTGGLSSKRFGPQPEMRQGPYFRALCANPYAAVFQHAAREGRQPHPCNR